MINMQEMKAFYTQEKELGNDYSIEGGEQEEISELGELLSAKLVAYDGDLAVYENEYGLMLVGPGVYPCAIIKLSEKAAKARLNRTVRPY